MGLFSRKKDEKKIDAAETEPPKVESKKETKAEPETEKNASEQASSAKQPKGAYFVSPHPDGGWQVKKANAQKALKRFDTKPEAEAYAKRVASNQGTNVVRKKKDGKIQKKH